MPTQVSEDLSESARRVSALSELQKGVNPFSNAVAAVGTAAESIQTDVRAHSEQQLEDLLKIVSLYRAGGPPTRIYPIVGDTGTGKTHLLYILRFELRHRAIRSSEETLFVVVERLAQGTDPIDYLLWQITNNMLANKGDGERLLRVLSGRLTGRLLAEAIRRLSPPQQIELIPASGFWQGVRMKFGSAKLAQERLEAVARLIEIADSGPEPSALRKACEDSGITTRQAIQVINRHLDQTQSKNADDWFRKELHGRIATFALLGDREPFDDFHNGGTEPPAFVKDGGNVSRCLLDTWLELLGTLRIPVVVVFDQLEEYLRGSTPEQEAINNRDFVKAITSFIDKVPSVCVLTFAAESTWNALINFHTDPYSRQRLAQQFSLPGQPARANIAMPGKPTAEVVLKLISARVTTAFPMLNLTGLQPGFPFDQADIESLSSQPNVRECLLKLGKRYDDIVHPVLVDKAEVRDRLRLRLATIWADQLATAKGEHGDKLPTTTTLIPKFQMALDGWLQELLRVGLTGSCPWAKVEVITKQERQQYGYLSLIRFEENKPGIGIAAWLGHKAPKFNNLVKVLEYFKDNPRPIQTLVLLRGDGEESLEGMCGDLYKKTRSKDKRDVRVLKYDTGFFHAVMGFSGWLQAALPELESMKKLGIDGNLVFREYLAEVSKPLLDWVDAWRQPLPAEGM